MKHCQLISVSRNIITCQILPDNFYKSKVGDGSQHIKGGFKGDFSFSKYRTTAPRVLPEVRLQNKECLCRSLREGIVLISNLVLKQYFGLNLNGFLTS